MTLKIIPAAILAALIATTSARAEGTRFVYGQWGETHGCVQYQVTDQYMLSSCGTGGALLQNGVRGFDMEPDKDKLGYCESDSGIKMDCKNSIPITEGDRGLTYKLSNVLRVAIGFDNSFLMTILDHGTLTTFIGVPPHDNAWHP